jgi:hypothetical protein
VSRSFPIYYSPKPRGFFQHVKILSAYLKNLQTKTTQNTSQTDIKYPQLEFENILYGSGGAVL